MNDLNKSESELKEQSKQSNRQAVIVMSFFGILLFVFIAYEIYSKK